MDDSQPQDHAADGNDLSKVVEFIHLPFRKSRTRLGQEGFPPKPNRFVMFAGEQRKINGKRRRKLYSKDNKRTKDNKRNAVARSGEYLQQELFYKGNPTADRSVEADRLITELASE